jgi:hypothetical protein
MNSFNLLIIGFFITFIAGLVRGLTCFGFAMVTVSLLIFFLPPQIVVSIVSILSIVTNIIMFLEVRKWIKIKEIWPLLVCGLIGIPFGTYLLLILEANLLKIIIGSVITLSAITMLMNFKRKIKKEKLGCGLIGMISGLLQGSTTVSGPPVALFLMNQDVKKLSFRANLAVYFLVMNFAGLVFIS